MNQLPKTSVRKCSACKGSGHNRRNCPLRQNPAIAGAVSQHPNAIESVETQPRSVATTVLQDHIQQKPNLDRSLYFVFDLETTGFVPRRDEIIEIAGFFLGPDKTLLENGVFDSLVRPNNPLNDSIITITGITNAMLEGKPDFNAVGKDLIGFVQNTKSVFEEEKGITVEHVILVAHNGKRFDIPFLFARFDANEIEVPSFMKVYSIDTMLLASRSIVSAPRSDVPLNYKLQSLYTFVTGGETLMNAHRAISDAKATVHVFQYQMFWDNREECIFPIDLQVEGHQNANDSDEDDDDELDDLSVTESQSDTIENNVLTGESNEIVTGLNGDRWERNGRFDPSSENIRSFNVSRVGLKISPSNVNTPIRSWRQIFTNYLLNTIVQHTNDYGERHCKTWTPVDTDDLTDFISVLFLMSIQKRKDKPSNWFSDDPLLQSPQVKRIMTGRQFAKMLRYIHCCPVDPPDGEYDPIYKVQELMDYILKRSSALFEPGEHLSLDETLIRTFGRIKFKVRIISKSARYGIKIYVVTDAKTAYVLNMIVYTGRDMTDIQDGSKKTVAIVRKLVDKYKNTFRHVFVDRFYTSFDLLSTLETDGLKMTGTVMSNRLPMGVRIAKNSKQFKDMRRGDGESFKLVYKSEKEEDRTAGLVVWKDSSMVYCLSNGCDNYTYETCKRRSIGGPITIPRPTVVGNYNANMGGVDLADMRRLQCNSTIMGQKRWWLKLFFYLLDVGTSNALVLYNEARKPQPPMNIADFKQLIVEHFVGERIVRSTSVEEEKEHIAVRTDNFSRLSCAYCSLHGRSSRTRYVCLACQTPLCCPGNGRTSVDCFRKAHMSNDLLGLVIERAEDMKKRTNISYRKRKTP